MVGTRKLANFKIIHHRFNLFPEPLRACIAFLIAGDIDHLLLANTSFTLVDRLKQALILHQVSKGAKYSDGLEKVEKSRLSPNS